MERLEASLIIGFGACVGSALRRSMLIQNPPASLSSNPLLRLLITAAGSFVAGLVTGYFMQLDPDGYSRAMAFLRNVGFLLAGIAGGYVTFPAFTREPVGLGEAPGAGIVAFRLFSSLIIAILFFYAGALFAH